MLRGQVMNWLRRISVLLLMLALVDAHVAVCAGWQSTPDARMDCCVEDCTCPMHEGKSDSSGSGKVLTQAEADSCCASSEREDSSPSNPTTVGPISNAVLGEGVVIAAPIPALVLTDHWRTAVPIPAAPVARHVLLSVFLV
jgi:hypothetical protein